MNSIYLRVITACNGIMLMVHRWIISQSFAEGERYATWRCRIHIKQNTAEVKTVIHQVVRKKISIMWTLCDAELLLFPSYSISEMNAIAKQRAFGRRRRARGGLSSTCLQMGTKVSQYEIRAEWKQPVKQLLLIPAGHPAPDLTEQRSRRRWWMTCGHCLHSHFGCNVFQCEAAGYCVNIHWTSKCLMMEIGES